MVISNFDVKNVAIFPRETNPELIINSDAQLPLSSCLQSRVEPEGHPNASLHLAREVFSAPGESSSEETFLTFLSTTTGASVNRGSS
jgi:hypothetical protein